MAKNPRIPGSAVATGSEGYARKLQFLISTHRVTMLDLADAIGVKKRALQDMIDGLTVPSPTMIEAICKHFGVSSGFFDGSTVAKRGAAKSEESKKPAAKSHSGAAPASPAAAAAAAAKKSLPAPAKKKVRNEPKAAVSPGHAPPESFQALAVRHQALLEALLEKGVISPADYHKQIQIVERRRIQGS